MAARRRTSAGGDAQLACNTEERAIAMGRRERERKARIRAEQEAAIAPVEKPHCIACFLGEVEDNIARADSNTVQKWCRQLAAALEDDEPDLQARIIAKFPPMVQEGVTHILAKSRSA